jgi:hypothetical protein
MKGGNDPTIISDDDFKYTIDPERIVWTKNSYKAGPHLFDLVKSIPWNTYSFNNFTTLWFPPNDDIPGSTYHSENIKIRASYPPNNYLPYKLAGGSLYEYINWCQPLAQRNLRQFIDPTGDIDVFVNTPIINYDLKEDPIQYYYEEDGTTLNTYIEDLTTWLMRQVQLKVTEIPLFVFDNTEEFEYTETNETHFFSDLHVPIGNLWLVRVKHSSMVKIQLLCKYIDCNPDHILEFVFDIYNDKDYSNKQGYYKQPSMIINGMHCQTYKDLIHDNVNSMTNRIDLHDSELIPVEIGKFPKSFMNSHKWMNHVQRMKWLNYNIAIIPPDVLDDSLNDIIDYFNFIKLHLSELCKFSYVKIRCLEKNILHELVSNFILINARRFPRGFIEIVKLFKNFMSGSIPPIYIGGKPRNKRTRKINKRKTLKIRSQFNSC